MSLRLNLIFLTTCLTKGIHREKGNIFQHMIKKVVCYNDLVHYFSLTKDKGFQSMKNMSIRALLLTFITIVNISQVHSMELQEPLLDTPLIRAELVSFFEDKKPLRIDISVGDASGRGEKALDFFIVDVTDSIPLTLRDILPRSEFISNMIKQMFHTSHVLMVTESISRVSGGEKVNGFIGIKATDVSDIMS